MIKKTALFISITSLFFITACEYEKLQPFGVGCDSEVSCKNEVMPIINARCVSCHFAGSGQSDFTSWPGLKAAADNGSIYNRTAVIKDMPLGGPALTDDELKKIDCWLKQGAKNN